MVDDGSLDNYDMLCDDYVKNGRQIKSICQINQSVSVARFLNEWREGTQVSTQIRV